MARAKEIWYVLVMTNDGPLFVTSVHNGNRMANWDYDSIPRSFPKSYAKEIANGLTLNGTPAYVVCMDVPKERQPYNYEKFEIKFVNRESEAGGDE